MKKKKIKRKKEKSAVNHVESNKSGEIRCIYSILKSFKR